MNIPDKILEQIKADAVDEWPDDKDMQEHIIREEMDGYRRCSKINFENFTADEKSTLIETAQEDYGSWEDIADSLIRELDAIEKLKTYSEKEITSSLIDQWKEEAEAAHENQFFDQLEYMNKKTSKYLNVKSTRKKIDPIKQLLIEMENIVGNECYNKNIQNYESWGVLSFSGRSFRYPVQFRKDDAKYKTRSVNDTIPSEDLITGYYAFGANELGIYRALYKVLQHLEENHGLILPEN
jgi:hypothetical protein